MTPGQYYVASIGFAAANFGVGEAGLKNPEFLGLALLFQLVFLIAQFGLMYKGFQIYRSNKAGGNNGQSGS